MKREIQPAYVSDELMFARSFPARGITIMDTDRGLGRRFQSTAGLLESMVYLEEQQRLLEILNPGTLDVPFYVRRKNITFSHKNLQIGLQPIEATDSLLIGSFDPAQLKDSENSSQESLSLLIGQEVSPEDLIGYAVIDRKTLEAASFGSMQYTGRIALSTEVLDARALDDIHPLASTLE